MAYLIMYMKNIVYCAVFTMWSLVAPSRRGPVRGIVSYLNCMPFFIINEWTKILFHQKCNEFKYHTFVANKFLNENSVVVCKIVYYYYYLNNDSLKGKTTYTKLDYGWQRGGVKQKHHWWSQKPEAESEITERVKNIRGGFN